LDKYRIDLSRGKDMSHKLAVLVFARRDFEREALAAILTEAGFEIGVRDPASDLDLPAASSLTGFQVALVDARISNPLGEIASLNALAPALKIALMAEGASAELVQRAFAVGAIGVVDRLVSCAILVRQLELLALGGCVIPLKFIDSLTQRQRSAATSLTDTAAKRLSIREREIVQCLATGMSNKVIARELRLSEPTVKVHVGAVLRKLNLANRTKVAVWAANGMNLAPAVVAPRPSADPHALNGRMNFHDENGREIL